MDEAALAEAKHRNLVEQIVNDIESHAEFRPFEDQISSDFVEAFRVQDDVAAELIRRGTRAPLCGYKIAVNSKHLLDHFGLSEPVSGQVFSDQKWTSPAGLRGADYRCLLIEPEIMAVMGRDLDPSQTHDRTAVEAAIERFLPAIELVDTRGVQMPTARLPSVIAQNVNNEGIVVGGPGLAPQDLDIVTLEVAITLDDRTVAEATGSAPQHPLDAIAWLANHLQHRGKMLKAGMVVMCGTHLPPQDLEGARQVCVRMGALGTVEFSIG